MRLIDISPKVSSRLAVWPGDVPFVRTVSLDLARGDNFTLSSIESTLHLGAHADAPSHYQRGGADIASRPLDLYVGPCQVLEVTVGRGARLTPEHLPEAVRAPRLLLRTGTYPNPEVFSRDFAALSPELVDCVAAQGVRLIGIDTPSVDLFDDKVLLAHQAIAARDLAILEGLVLSAVTPGLYTLVALPLPLVGADASPVRAVLLEE